MLYVEWRDRLGSRQLGPAIRIQGDGKLLLGQTPADCRIPDGAWVHIEMVDGLGALADGLWDLKITTKDRMLFERKGVSCDRDFASIQWLGIVRNGNQPCVFYVDNMKFETLPQ